MVGKTRYFIQIPQYYWIMGELSVNIKKTTKTMFVFILKSLRNQVLFVIY